MSVDREKTRRASVNFKLLWQKTLQNGLMPQQVLNALDIIGFEEQDTDTVYRTWFKELPKLTRWIGDRSAQQLQAEELPTQLHLWEATLKVEYPDILFDRLGGYKKQIANMSREFKLHPYRQLCRMLEDGWTGAYGNCFDGYVLFSASHPTGNNAGTGALTAANLATAEAAMRAQVDSAGDSLYIEPTHLWYHKSLQATAEDILDRDLISDGETAATTIRNKYYQKYKKLPLDLGSSYTAYWGLMCLDGGEMKPAIYTQMGSENKLEENDSLLFNQNTMLYGIQHYGRMYPGYPQYVYGSTGAG